MKFEHLSIAYWERTVLRDISLEISPWDFVFLIGTSGSGKTSFIRSIIGALAPTKWSIITHHDKKLKDLSKNELLKYRRSIGVIFQDFKLLSKKTVYENVAFAMEVCGYTDETISRRVPEVLAQVGLLQKKNKFIEALSGWELQRTAIARALIHNPDIIIGDEPTGNLDPKNAEEIIALLLKLNSEWKTILLATHDDRLVNTLWKRVISLKDGRLYSDDTPGIYNI
jgi:cell division transport system ATP-binding protein